MIREHKFGGNWTEQKLAKLKGYLEAYSKIFDRNLQARYFETYYVDAFAGTGSRSSNLEQKADETLFPELRAQEVVDFTKGSARIALEVQPGFNKYLFIEENEGRVRELEQLKSDYPESASRIIVRRGDANSVLMKWCKSVQWNKTRAVVFLDPYGMQVEWALLKELAATQAIDLWLLFPLGTGVMRVLTKRREPPPEWSSRLTKLFGSEEWKTRFYRESPQGELFSDAPSTERAADYKQISDYLVERLMSIFPGVQKTPLPLYNSTNCPLYLLAFAAGNPKGAPTAIKIANHLLKS